MNIQIDTREKQRAIKKILAEFNRQGIRTISSKLFVGDYMNMDNPRVIIDRKQSLGEVYQNLCHGAKRINNEFSRAKEFGIQIILLVEHGKDIKNLDDVKTWENPQLEKTPYAWDGEKLYKEMLIIQSKYDIKWEFCEKNDTGKRIIELLK